MWFVCNCAAPQFCHAIVTQNELRLHYSKPFYLRMPEMITKSASSKISKENKVCSKCVIIWYLKT